MAVLKVEAEFNTRPIQNLINVFPDLGGRFLSLVGKRARTKLKQSYLSGQEITLRQFPTDRRGRTTITSDVNRKRTQVKVYSYPVNLFEKGRRLRSGRKEPGRYIITRKLKQDVMTGFSGYITDFESKILGPEVKKVNDV